MTGLYWEEWEVGREFETGGRTVTEADIVMFAGLSGDYNPLHTNEEFAKQSPVGRRIMQGSLVTSVVDGLISRMGLFEGTAITFLACTWEFKAPVFIGDTIRARIRVADRRPSKKGGRGVVTFAVAVVNQAGTDVVIGTWTMMLVAKSPGA